MFVYLGSVTNLKFQKHTFSQPVVATGGKWKMDHGWVEMKTPMGFEY